MWSYKVTANYHDEIVELHRFFEKWFNGEIDENDANFERFVDVLDDGFHIINPEGRMAAREPLVRWIRGAYASQPDLRIWVDNIQLQQQHKDVLIVTYKEWQETTSTLTARQSTVVFREDEAAPNGLIWMHVHETWLSR